MDDANTFKTDAIHEENPAIQDRTVLAAFTDVESANRARDALNIAGYKDVEITSGDPADAGKPVHEHGFWNRLKSMFGGHNDTPVYAEAIRGGHTLVTVHTEQGRSAYAIDILDGFGPIDIKGGQQAWIDNTPGAEPRSTTMESDLVPTTATLNNADLTSEVEEEVFIVEHVPDEGNERVRSYARNLPVVVATQDRGVAATEVSEEPLAKL